MPYTTDPLCGDICEAVVPPNQPPTLSNLNQYKSDGIFPIAEGGTTTKSTIVFKAFLSDPDDDQVRLQVELKEYNQPFNEQGLLESDLIDSGQTTQITRYGLIPASYHWRARAIDEKGTVSDWQEFGEIGNVDFVVKTLEQAAADLAKLVIDASYLGDGDTYGGKGWDPTQALYVSSNGIFNGYNYWNNKLRTIAFGAGLDCSGLVEWAFNRAFDLSKPYFQNVIRFPGANGEYKNNSETITEADLQPGDLMFFDGEPPAGHIDHVAMYVDSFTYNGEGRDVIEAHSPARGIITSLKDDLKILPEFLALGPDGFRRVVISPEIGGQVNTGSPIDLIVTDPDGLTITPTTAIQTNREYLREVPGDLYYSERILGADGRPEDTVYWPTTKVGNYTVEVLPEADASPTETYSLEFTAGSQTTILAENVPINQIPSEGYGVEVTESGTISPFVPVSIDIKPGSFPNSINLGSRGVVPVAIFGSATFDVNQIDPVTVTLANASIKLKGNSQPMASYEDVNGDSIFDMVVHVITEALELTETDIQAELNGFLLDGRNIKGFDSTRVVP